MALSKSKCKFKKICSTLYDSEFKKVCMFTNNSITECHLLKEIKNNQISDFVLSIIQKEAKVRDTDTPEIDAENVTCPRSLLAKVSLKKSCPLDTCPFYSEKMTYNCFMIHHNVYFPDNPNLPQKTLEIGTSLDTRTYNRLIDVGIYLSRLYIVLLKFKIEFLHDDTSLKFKTKTIRKLLRTNKIHGICQICNSIIPSSGQCKCNTDGLLRDKRIRFNQSWINVIKKNKILIKETNIFNISTEEFCNLFGNKVHGLKFMRAILNTVKMDNLRLVDVPFGFIYNTYSQLFDETEWRKAENLGLSEELNEQAFYLYKVNN